MRKLALLLIFFLLAMRVFVLNAFADPAPTPVLDLAQYGNGWVHNYKCDASKGLYSGSASTVPVMSPYNDTARDFANNPIFTPYCIDENEVGSLYDFESGFDIFGEKLSYCKKGYVTAKDSILSTTNEFVKITPLYLYSICCPITQPYMVSKVTNIDTWNIDVWRVNVLFKQCCNASEAVDDKGFCNMGKGEKGTKPISYNYAYPGDYAKDKDFREIPGKIIPFPAAIESYICATNNCLIQQNTTGVYSMYQGSDNNFSKDEIVSQKLFCVESVDLSNPEAVSGKDPSNKNVCYNSDFYDIAYFEDWKNMLGTISNCHNMADASQIQSCLSCYEICKGQTECRVKYTGLGCFPTDSGDLLTRIFQIGVGILGVVGILQIMYAAMLRQTADPAKIQESWDIIIALILGIVLLLGANIILRFIGVDILQLLPFDFLK